MRTYNQYCALAKALDVIGERWTLLIVRELLAFGPARYTDLLHGLPGIATNLLADRLAMLEAEGIIYREEAPPPIATSLIHLTERGKALTPLMQELGHWGETLLAEYDDDEFRTHWLVLPVRRYLEDHSPDRPPITIELRTGDRPLVIEVGSGEIRTTLARVSQPDAVLGGPPDLIVGVLLGRLSLEEARERGLEYEGDPETLRRVQPGPTEAASERLSAR
ncbi:MAG TPA: helix-turn-helix domain-containing protein [Chloroflexota bacterium]